MRKNNIRASRDYLLPGWPFLPCIFKPEILGHLHGGADSIILTEVLQGIREDSEFNRTQDLLGNLVFLPMQYYVFLRSAEIYRNLRRKGITIRKPVDCMIAAVAIENDIPLLHNDKDFIPIEKHFGLKRLNK